MASVHLKNIRKSFSNQQVIDHLRLDVEDGEFVSILGPSGCGKTTCLRLISGLESPDKGDICFGNVSILATAPEKRGVGMVFQHYALFPHMTVEQNVIFGLKIRGEPKDVIQRKLDDILDIVQLQAEVRKYPAELSGGQMQRVALARTLITHPNVLLLDEPFANLDANLRNDMRAFVRDLQQRMGITTILVTHDQQEAMELSNRVAVMFDGKIVQYDKPEKIFYQPKDARIAGFLGSVNLLSGRAIASGEFESEIGHLVVDCQFISAADSDMASVRPERVQLVELGNQTIRENCFLATIRQIRFNGAFNEITLLVGNKAIICIELSGKERASGQQILVHFPREDLWMMQGTQ